MKSNHPRLHKPIIDLFSQFRFVIEEAQVTFFYPRVACWKQMSRTSNKSWWLVDVDRWQLAMAIYFQFGSKLPLKLKVTIVLMQDMLHHLGCINPGQWRKKNLPTSTGYIRRDFWTINNSTTNPTLPQNHQRESRNQVSQIQQLTFQPQGAQYLHWGGCWWVEWSSSHCAYQELLSKEADHDLWLFGVDVGRFRSSWEWWGRYEVVV